MCDALAELGEEGNEDYLVCSCMHSFIACLAFQVFDFFAIFITLIIYAAVIHSRGASLFTVLPLIVLLSSAGVLPLGVIGLLYQHANLLVIYNTRLSLFVIWCIVWMGVSLMYQGGFMGVIASVIWFIIALLYCWGLYVTSKALTYITTHYRGFDDVDPERVQFIEQMLRDRIDEIKQKEIDIAAGAIVTERTNAAKDFPSKSIKYPEDMMRFYPASFTLQSECWAIAGKEGTKLVKVPRLTKMAHLITRRRS